MLKVKDRKKCLSKDNYCQLLILLLYLEEHQMSIDIREYDTEHELEKASEYMQSYELKVSYLNFFYECYKQIKQF